MGFAAGYQNSSAIS